VRILANENVPGEAVDALRARGHDVLWARTDLPGSPDPRVLGLDVEQSRILITFDKDFGELVFRRGLPACCGIILFRTGTPSPAATAEQLAAVLESRADWAGSFAVVEPGRLRMVPLPPAK